MNVLFTLWLLRTAQRQLSLMRQQSVEQHEDSTKQISLLTTAHEAERQEAQEQLASLQDQLTLVKQAHLAERREAAQSIVVAKAAADEALKARLDQLAPRVSLAVTGARIGHYERQSNGEVVPTKQIPDIDKLVGLANQWLAVVFLFELKNWGNEPVAVSTPSPWKEDSSGLLFPGERQKMQHSFNVFTHDLVAVAERGLRQSEAEPHWTLTVVVNDISGQVTDYHTWRVLPTPFKLENRRVVNNVGWERTYAKFALRQRHYHTTTQTTGDDSQAS